VTPVPVVTVVTVAARMGSGSRRPGETLRHAASAPALPGTRWASVARAAYGAALLCAPGPIVRMITGVPATPRVRSVVRVLGVRHLAQAAVCGLVPARGLIRAGTATDGLHSASMLALAGVEPRLRRALLADAAVAAAFAAAAEAALRLQ
jgi:hypothetical protein